MVVHEFEKWLLTGEGKRALRSFKNAPNPDKEYLKNCLWWAFYAGRKAQSLWLKSPIEEVLTDISKSKTITVSIRRQVEYILQHKDDFKINNL